MYYQINRETQKLELVFSKEEYQALPEADKKDIKSNFLFSRSISGWVSRAKWPHTSWAEGVAKRLGAENRGKIGEALSFAEQQERKAERAEARAERMEYRLEKSEAEAERLQKPINDMRGDIAFFTQPNINSAGGRAFTNRRNKMYAAYERGWEEFKKSEYYAERAEIARRTAAEAKAPSDKGFCERRIAEAEKTIRAQRKNIEHYNSILAEFDKNSEYVYKTYTAEYNREDVEGWIENAEEIIDRALSKAIYYREAIETMGGIEFSRENIKPGYIVELSGWNNVAEVVSCGPKNVKYKTSFGSILTANYGEIKRIVKSEEKAAEQHPFKVGDKFDVEIWNSKDAKRQKIAVEVVKSTDKSVTLQNTETAEKWNRKPQKREGACYEGGAVWAVFLTDDYYSGCFKKITT